MTVAVGSVLLVVSSTGMALLQSAPWTLAEKATAFGSFQNPRHSREGLTSSVNLRVYGFVDSYVQNCQDNDGLWTSMHAMAEVYRYMASHEQEARDWAWQAFEALERLAILPGA
jgi:hypothetical protein